MEILYQKKKKPAVLPLGELQPHVTLPTALRNGPGKRRMGGLQHSQNAQWHLRPGPFPLPSEHYHDWIAQASASHISSNKIEGEPCQVVHDVSIIVLIIMHVFNPSI